MRYLLVALVLCSSLFSGTFTVASYNVQNLFDLKRSGSEYVDYIPFTKAKWNTKNYRKKLHNLAKVISDLNPDIIALQEVESPLALKDLQLTIRRLGITYRYKAITKVKSTTVHTAILSKFPIRSQAEIVVNPYDRIRSILDVTLDIKGKTLRIFVNHWKSKGGPESKRIPYAKALAKSLSAIKGPYLLVGDFNSNYNEFQTFKKVQRHNNTKGVTGINHILKTIHKGKLNTFASVKNSSKDRLYNLWMDLPLKKRWSYLFRGKDATLDNIIIPKTLLDKKGIEYLEKSFKRFMPSYIVKGRKIFRWKYSKKGGAKHHIGKGYSDHIPIVAKFSY